MLKPFYVWVTSCVFLKLIPLAEEWKFSSQIAEDLPFFFIHAFIHVNASAII